MNVKDKNYERYDKGDFINEIMESLDFGKETLAYYEEEIEVFFDKFGSDVFDRQLDKICAHSILFMRLFSVDYKCEKKLNEIISLDISSLDEDIQEDY